MIPYPITFAHKLVSHKLILFLPYSDIKVVLHLDLFQAAQRRHRGEVLHLVVAEVQKAQLG